MLRQSFLTATIAALLAAVPSHAAEADKALPGVKAPPPRVAPVPAEPEQEDSGTMRVGKWEVTVSGLVWVEIGASTARGK